MSLQIVSRPYDAGRHVGAVSTRDERCTLGAIVYVVKFLSNGLYEVTETPSANGPLGIVTHILTTGTLQVQTDGTLTMAGLISEESKVPFATGDSITWDSHGVVSTERSTTPARPNQCIGYVLHHTPTTVRFQITHH